MKGEWYVTFEVLPDAGLHASLAGGRVVLHGALHQHRSQDVQNIVPAPRKSLTAKLLSFSYPYPTKAHLQVIVRCSFK
jgi:hypothetical protein